MPVILSFRSEIERKMLNDLQILQLEGVELDFKDAGIAGASPLHIAAANGYLSVVEFLLEHHVSTDVEDDDLWQPIHAAACWGHLEGIGFTPKPLIYQAFWAILYFNITVGGQTFGPAQIL